jgi:hypothetical protein
MDTLILILIILFLIFAVSGAFAHLLWLGAVLVAVVVLVRWAVQVRKR